MAQKYTPAEINDALKRFDHLLRELSHEDRAHARVLIAVAENHLLKQFALERFTNAIRRFTVDAPDDKPNGPVEAAIDGLLKALSVESWRAFGPKAFNIANGWGAKLCQALAADTKELLEAANEYFGDDFAKPNETHQETTP